MSKILEDEIWRPWHPRRPSRMPWRSVASGIGFPPFVNATKSTRHLFLHAIPQSARRQDAPDLNLDALTSERIFGGERTQAWFACCNDEHIEYGFPRTPITSASK